MMDIIIYSFEKENINGCDMKSDSLELIYIFPVFLTFSNIYKLTFLGKKMELNFPSPIVYLRISSKISASWILY